MTIYHYYRVPFERSRKNVLHNYPSLPVLLNFSSARLRNKTVSVLVPRKTNCLLSTRSAIRWNPASPWIPIRIAWTWVILMNWSGFKKRGSFSITSREGWRRKGRRRGEWSCQSWTLSVLLRYRRLNRSFLKRCSHNHDRPLYFVLVQKIAMIHLNPPLYHNPANQHKSTPNRHDVRSAIFQISFIIQPLQQDGQACGKVQASSTRSKEDKKWVVLTDHPPRKPSLQSLLRTTTTTTPRGVLSLLGNHEGKITSRL